jgi:imidazolonepropionase-like amidohydrolase
VVVTPGLVDVRGTVGLSGLLNQDGDQEVVDEGAALQPELRALDAYNGRDPLVDWVLAFGVTTVQTGHAPGPVVGGQTVVVKTHKPYVADAVVQEAPMLTMTIGESTRRYYDSPGTRAKAVAELRNALYAARAFADEPDSSRSRDLGKEALAALLAGEKTALVEAHRAHDILTALRLREEFGFPMVLSGASEAYLVLDEIRAAGVPVALHPTMARATGEQEHLSMETAELLREAGIPFAIQSGYEPYVPKTRVVLFEAGVAAAHGLAKADALHAVTLGAARILGLDDRIGSIEPGKQADLALFDGDPFETTSHVCAVVVAGDVIRETCQ